MTPNVIWPQTLLIWSQMRYHCTTRSTDALCWIQYEDMHSGQCLWTEDLHSIHVQKTFAVVHAPGANRHSLIYFICIPLNLDKISYIKDWLLHRSLFSFLWLIAILQCNLVSLPPLSKVHTLFYLHRTARGMFLATRQCHEDVRILASMLDLE